jgi:hypothetical protein
MLMLMLLLMLLLVPVPMPMTTIKQTRQFLFVWPQLPASGVSLFCRCAMQPLWRSLTRTPNHSASVPYKQPHPAKPCLLQAKSQVLQGGKGSFQLSQFTPPHPLPPAQ